MAEVPIPTPPAPTDDITLATIATIAGQVASTATARQLVEESASDAARLSAATDRVARASVALALAVVNETRAQVAALPKRAPK